MNSVIVLCDYFYVREDTVISCNGMNKVFCLGLQVEPRQLWVTHMQGCYYSDHTDNTSETGYCIVNRQIDTTRTNSSANECGKKRMKERERIEVWQ